MYYPYNDYELLYLYQEGNEKAFDMLCNKYSHLIEARVSSIHPYGEKREDLVQEGYMIFLDCVRNYREFLGVPFYSYFSVSLSRGLHRLIGEDYYTNLQVLNESVLANVSDTSGSSYLLKIARNLVDNTFDDYLYIDIYNECLIGNLPLKVYAKKIGVPYTTVYYNFQILRSMLQKHFKKF